ncbi:MAG TPA: sulfite exporter TauE/SafE family protein [Xanthobacteraceae bacterium]|nr:sulfite exporter TauE/SafE family protein [Xanthobacteraceae bacterium]
MLSGVPVGELAILAAAILAAGIIAGLIAGLLGIGGALITVPVLYELFRFLGAPDAVRMQLCIGTSLAVIVPISLRSFFAHRAKSAVRTHVLRIWAVPVVLGVITGSVIAYYAPAALFKWVFVVFGYAMAARYLVGRDSWRIGQGLPGTATLAVVGYFIGLVSSLIGVAGGAMSTLFLTLFGETIHVAIATSAGLGVLISVPGAIGYMIAGWPQEALMPPLSVGYVSFLGLLLFAPASVLAAPYGAQLAHKLSKKRLEVVFGLFMAAIATRFLISLFF